MANAHKKQVLDICSDVGIKLKELFRAAYELANEGRYRAKVVAQAIQDFNLKGWVPTWVINFMSGGHHLRLKAA